MEPALQKQLLKAQASLGLSCKLSGGLEAVTEARGFA